MVKGGTRPYRDLILRDRLGHAGVKVKWEPVEARHGVNAQADAQRPGIKGVVSYWRGVGLNGVAKWGTSSHKAGDQHRPLQ